MRSLVLVVTCLLVGCGSAPANMSRDYKGVFEGEKQVAELIEKVKLADQYFFRPDQKVFLGLQDGKLATTYEGTLARHVQPGFISDNEYHIRFALFAGGGNYDNKALNEGLIVAGISPDEFEDRSDSQKADFVAKGSALDETVSEFAVENGRCHLIRRERQGRVISTLAIVKYSSTSVSSYRERKAKGVEFIQDEISAVYCVNIAHLYHFGFSNISAVTHDDVVYLAQRNTPAFGLNLKLFFNAIAYRGDQTGLSRKDFLRSMYVWLLAESKEPST